MHGLKDRSHMSILVEIKKKTLTKKQCNFYAKVMESLGFKIEYKRYPKQYPMSDTF